MAKKPKFVPTQQQRIDATRFVAYEVWMFRECANTPKPRTRVAVNIWYEVLVLHARVLRDFFFTKHDEKGKRSTQDTDIVAVDYFSNLADWPYTSRNLPPYLELNKVRMDRALAHLSFHRLTYTGNGKDWSAQSLRAEIGPKWLEFVQKLQDLGELAATSFLRHARSLKIPVTAPF